MTETSEKSGRKKKKPIHILRERRGGVPRELTEMHRRQKRIVAALLEALGDGPKTVPELTASTGIPSHEVLWHVMALKKYSEVVEAEEAGGYMKYAAKEKE